MKISTKVLLSLGSLSVITITMAITAYQASQRVELFREHFSESQGEFLAITGLRALVRNELLEAQFTLLTNPAGLGKTLREQDAEVNEGFGELERKVAAHVDQRHPTVLGEEDIRALRSAHGRIASALQKMVGNPRPQAALREAKEEAFGRYFLAATSRMIEKKSHELILVSGQLAESSVHLQGLLALCSILAAVLAVGLALFVFRPIGRRLRKVEKATAQISAGDLTVTLPEDGHDEVALLSQSFNHMARSLTGARAQLVQQQQLLANSSKMSAMGEMAGGIAHEINTPLAVIKLYSDQLIEEGRERRALSPEFALEAGQNIDKTVERITKIIRGLRFFSRDASQDPMEPADLSVIVEETLSLCRQKAAERGIRIEWKRPEAPVKIKCRPAQVSQVLVNLLNNSFDALRAAPRKWIKLLIEQDAGSVSIFVVDSGPGIPPAVAKKLMQPFFTTKEIGQGTGLGLSVSKGIMETHGGRLTFEETAGDTTFRLYWPMPQGSA